VACGVERWQVKTGSDPAARTVSLTPVRTTLSALSALPAPVRPAADHRYTAENTVWQITAQVTSYKEEADKDLHLALSDDGGRQMIAEIAAPSCMASGSPFGRADQAVREAWLSRHRLTTSFVNLIPPVRVTVTGVGFFDHLHGQRGVAPNGIELHPLLSLQEAAP
jgi:hypothetical protein